ncbi:hypothetical protein LTR08_006280 [Meristemomyces frigidus]|nr:hypothetical protein LTR08_006280 [Meristemomyces frigidus]
MAAPPQKKASLAILDDYANVAPKHFAHIQDLRIDSFPDTLDPHKPSDLDQLVRRLQPYQIISSMRERTPFPAALLTRLPELKLLLNSSARNAAIDLRCAAERGVIVTGTKGLRPSDPGSLARLEALPPPSGFSSVVQHAWALVLALCSRLPRDDGALKRGEWQSGLMGSLAGLTLGVVGLGKLGTGMARVGALAWGMEVVAWSPNLTQAKVDQAAESVGCKGWRCVGKEELFARADVVSVHLVLSERSRGVVGRGELAAMKNSAVLVNTSRGPLVDEAALVEALKEGSIGGACLDVFWEEPLPEGSVWRKTDEWAKSEVVLSPHMGYANKGTMERWYQEQGEEAGRWMRGEEVVNRMS